MFCMLVTLLLSGAAEQSRGSCKLLWLRQQASQFCQMRSMMISRHSCETRTVLSFSRCAFSPVKTTCSPAGTDHCKQACTSGLWHYLCCLHKHSLVLHPRLHMLQAASAAIVNLHAQAVHVLQRPLTRHKQQSQQFGSCQYCAVTATWWNSLAKPHMLLCRDQGAVSEVGLCTVIAVLLI